MYEQQPAYQAFLVANMNDAVITLDHLFNITRWNSGAETIYGEGTTFFITWPKQQATN